MADTWGPDGARAGMTVTAGEMPPPLDDEPTLEPGAKLGSYRLLEVLGSGGMGYVWRAEHVKLGRQVALKMLRRRCALDADAVARFFAEARAVNSIKHEHIIEVTDFLELPEGSAYVMELLEGESLAAALRRERFSLARILDVAGQVASAMVAVHAASIVHRDLKPDNIFLTVREGKEFVKLLDFGVAKLAPGDSAVETLAGALLGTPAYMSPEQLVGKPVDARSDIYAFGVILYELAAGRRPFTGESTGALVIQHATVPAPPLPDDVDARFADLVLRCLAKEPAARPASMNAVAAELAALAAAPLSPRARVQPPVATASGKRTLALLAAALAAGVVVVTAVGVRVNRPRAAASPSSASAASLAPARASPSSFASIGSPPSMPASAASPSSFVPRGSPSPSLLASAAGPSPASPSPAPRASAAPVSFAPGGSPPSSPSSFARTGSPSPLLPASAAGLWPTTPSPSPLASAAPVSFAPGGSPSPSLPASAAGPSSALPSPLAAAAPSSPSSAASPSSFVPAGPPSPSPSSFAPTRSPPSSPSSLAPTGSPSPGVAGATSSPASPSSPLRAPGSATSSSSPHPAARARGGAPANPATGAQVRVRLLSTPLGAEVRDAGGAVLGKTPLTVARPRGGHARFIFRLGGQERTATVTLDADRTARVNFDAGGRSTILSPF